MNMRAANAEFQARPEAFRRVDVDIAARPFFRAVVDGTMRIAMARQFGIGLEFIAANFRTARYILKNMRFKGFFSERSEQRG